MDKFRKNFDRYLKVYFLVSIILLSLGFVLLYKKVDKLAVSLGEKSSLITFPIEFPQSTPSAKSDVCGENCQKEIRKIVDNALATISSSIKKTAESSKTTTVAVPVLRGETTYIPLAGPITTTSIGWVDAAGTDVYIDLANEYGKAATVSWDAFLKVAHGNGQAFARLYDVTHGIAVSGSEISTVNNETSTQVSSGNLNLWAGKNLYRVQIKSLNSFEVTFGSGRIKINY